MTVKHNNSKGKKIKCKLCKELNFFLEEDVIIDDKNRFVLCEHCGKKIKLKKI